MRERSCNIIEYPLALGEVLFDRVLGSLQESYRKEVEGGNISFALERHYGESVSGRTKVLAIEVNVVTVDFERIRFEASIATLSDGEVRTTPSRARDTPQHIIPAPSRACDTPQHIILALKRLRCCHHCIEGDRSSWKPQGHIDILAWSEDVPKVPELNLAI
jgi:hypothetical protein